MSPLARATSSSTSARASAYDSISRAFALRTAATRSSWNSYSASSFRNASPCFSASSAPAPSLAAWHAARYRFTSFFTGGSAPGRAVVVCVRRRLRMSASSSAALIAVVAAADAMATARRQ